MLRTVIETTPDDLVPVVYLLANRIASAHEGLELGIGETSIIKALAEACGAKEAYVKKQYKELGDLGLVAKASRSSQPLICKPEELTVAKIFDTFRLIAKLSKARGAKKRLGVLGLKAQSEALAFPKLVSLGIGFSEAMLEDRSASLRSKVISKPKSYYRYSDSLSPDVWFEPTEVWEVKAADLTISPVHRAAIGIVNPEKGISLLFPRLLRVREDKNPQQASSSDMVADMYNAQKHNQRDDQDDNEDD